MKVLRPELRKKNHLQKAKWLKMVLEQEGYNVRSYEILLKKVSRINSYKHKRIKKLKDDEVALYDLLLKNEINPRPVEDWLISTKLPDELKYRYRKGELTFLQAYSEYVKKTRLTKHEIAKNLADDIKEAIGRF
tara:strand:+ start:161 stop:562 length:402 start_codon:yes stop_codon:yes gene_type:complete